MLFTREVLRLIGKNWITTGCAYEIKGERLVSTIKPLQNAKIKFRLWMVGFFLLVLKTSLKMSLRLENVKAYSETLSRLKSPEVAIFFVPILLKSP